MGLSEFRVPYSGVLIIRILLFRVLYYIRVPIFGKSYVSSPFTRAWSSSLEAAWTQIPERIPNSRRDATKECCIGIPQVIYFLDPPRGLRDGPKLAKTKAEVYRSHIHLPE